MKPSQWNRGDLSHSACLRQAQQGSGQQHEQKTRAREPGVQWQSRSVPCCSGCWTSSEGEVIFSWLFLLWAYKERKFTYDFKKPKQSFRGIIECNRECTVCKNILDEKLTAANSPLHRFLRSTYFTGPLKTMNKPAKISNGRVLIKKIDQYLIFAVILFAYLDLSLARRIGCN